MYGFCPAKLFCCHTHHHQQMLCSEMSHLQPYSFHLSIQNTHASPRKKCIPSDRDVLVGDLAGALHEVIVDEKDKKEKVAKRVFQLQDSKDPISSVYQHQVSPGQRMVLMATSKRLYVFSGKGGLETMFARYTSPGTSIFAQSPCCLWCVLSVRRMAGAETCKVFLSMNLTVLSTSLQHSCFVSLLSCV